MCWTKQLQEAAPKTEQFCAPNKNIKYRDRVQCCCFSLRHIVFTDCSTVIYQFQLIVHHFTAPVAMLFEWLPARWLVFIPDSFRCQHHSAGEPPAWHLHNVSQSGLPGTGRIRGVCLPQRQDLPLSRGAQLHLPGHEQHLPLELTWEQNRWSQTPLTSAQELLRSRLVRWYVWRRVDVIAAEMELSHPSLSELSGFRLVQKHPSPLPAAVCWRSGLLHQWQYQSSSLKSGRLHMNKNNPLLGQNFYFSTLGSL